MIMQHELILRTALGDVWIEHGERTDTKYHFWLLVPFCFGRGPHMPDGCFSADEYLPGGKWTARMLLKEYFLRDSWRGLEDPRITNFGTWHFSAEANFLVTEALKEWEETE